jgi:hypothetical protein
LRRVVVLLISALLVAIPAGPVDAWSNGSEGCNSFGTHDWILRKAIKAAGKKASWVRVRVALRATDDPDCKDGIDHASGTWWHVYDEWGNEWGGADEATRVWFRRTKRRLEAGRERAASRALGIMSHFIADVANPMHTDSSDKEESIHSPYESDVDERIRDYPFKYDGRDSAKPGARTRRVARVAHRSYWDLVNAYDAHGYNRKVHRITKRQLKRAANALADLLVALR